jgi:hypothetical protein
MSSAARKWGVGWSSEEVMLYFWKESRSKFGGVGVWVVRVEGCFPLLHKFVVEFGALHPGDEFVLVLPIQLHLQRFLLLYFPEIFSGDILYYGDLFEQFLPSLLQHQG